MATAVIQWQDIYGRFSLPLTCANHHLANINKSEIAENASHVSAYPSNTIYSLRWVAISCYLLIEPCGEAAHEDDSESGSPFLYVYVNQSFTTSESAIRVNTTYAYGRKQQRFAEKVWLYIGRLLPQIAFKHSKSREKWIIWSLWHFCWGRTSSMHCIRHFSSW